MQQSHYRHQRGFNLIELVIVMLVVTILAVYATPSNIINPNLNLDTITQQFANDIRYAQTLAMTQAQRFSVIGGTNYYQILNASGTAIALPNGGTIYNFPSGYTISGVGGQFIGAITFDNFGVPYYSAVNTVPGTPITTASSVYISGLSGTSSTITVTPNTGRVTTS